MIRSKIGRVAAVLAALAIPAGGLTVLTSGVASAATTNTVQVTAGVVGLGTVTCGTPTPVSWASLATPTTGVCKTTAFTNFTAALSNVTKNQVVNNLQIPSADILIVTGPHNVVVVCDVSINATIPLIFTAGTNTYSATVTLTNTGIAGNAVPFVAYGSACVTTTPTPPTGVSSLNHSAVAIAVAVS